MAFLDAGNQFIALSVLRRRGSDDSRHFGLVVDNSEALRQALKSEGVEILTGHGLDFLDPWGNRIQVVQYDVIQFTKTAAVLGKMGLDGLGKTARAEAELREKGFID